MKSLITCILLLLCLYACNKPDELSPSSAFFKFNLTDTANVKADGVSIFTLSVSIPPNSAEKFKKIIFSATTLGTFITSSTQTVDTGGKATVKIRVGIDSGYHLLSASIDGSTIKKDITYFINPARADSLLVDANKSFADTLPGMPTEFTVYYKRMTGLVSKGSLIEARAFQVRNVTDTIPVGRIENLSNKKTDATGVIKFNYYTDTRDIDNTKLVTVEVSAWNDANTKIKKSYLLRVK